MAAKKKTVTKRAPVPRALGPLVAEVRSLIRSARHAAASTVNTLQVRTNYEIGRRIVEYEQKGGSAPGMGRNCSRHFPHACPRSSARDSQSTTFSSCGNSSSSTNFEFNSRLLLN